MQLAPETASYDFFGSAAINVTPDRTMATVYSLVCVFIRVEAGPQAVDAWLRHRRPSVASLNDGQVSGDPVAFESAVPQRQGKSQPLTPVAHGLLDFWSATLICVAARPVSPYYAP